jgi:hypothetical protein
MVSRKIRNLNLLDILVSLPTDPNGMMRHLLVERERPPYLFLSLLASFLILVAPAMYWQHLLATVPPDLSVVYSSFLVCGLTLLSFVIFTSILMRILTIKASPLKVLAITIYSLLGLIPLMFAFYLVNYSATGDLSILTYLCTGQFSVDDWSLPLFHVVTKAGAIFFFWLFVNGIKALGKTSLLSALSTSLVAIPVFAGSYAVALTLANNAFPGTSFTIHRFLMALFTPLSD